MSGSSDPSDLAKARSEYAVIMAQIGVKQLQIERGELIKTAEIEGKIAAYYGLDSQRLNLALVAILRKFLEDFADSDD
jgi:hypothetical protein